MITPKIVFDDGLGPVRTNMCFFSEVMDNAAWGKQAGGVGIAPIVTANFALSPRGDLTAERVQFNKGGGVTLSDLSLLNSNFFTSVNALSYANSIWLKSNTAGNFLVQLTFNGNAGVGGGVVTVTPAWQRFSLINIGDGATKDIRLGLRGTTGSDDTADILVWGGQVEPGSTAVTDYIVVPGAVAATSTQTTLIPTYPPMDKLGADELNSIRHDSITTSGVKQSIAERTETFINLNFKWVPASDIPVWQQFMTWALAGGIFTYYPDNTVPQFPVAKQYTLEDDNWQPKRVAVGHYSFQLRGRLWVP
jgi:hypothetical protein